MEREVGLQQLVDRNTLAKKKADVLRGWITAAQPGNEPTILPQVTAQQKAFDNPPTITRERYERRAVLASPVRLGQFREQAIPKIRDSLSRLEQASALMDAQIEGYSKAEEYVAELDDYASYLSEMERLAEGGHISLENLADFRRQYEERLALQEEDEALRLNVERIRKRREQIQEAAPTDQDSSRASRADTPQLKTIAIDGLPFTPDTVIGKQVELVVRALLPLRRDHIVTQHELARILKLDVTRPEADSISEILDQANELLGPAGYRISFAPNKVSFSNPGYYGEPLRQDGLSFTILGEVIKINAIPGRGEVTFRLSDTERQALWGITANRYGNFDTDVTTRWLRDRQSPDLSLEDLVASINAKFMSQVGAADVLVPVGNPDFGRIHKIDASYIKKDNHNPVFPTRLAALDLFFSKGGNPDKEEFLKAFGHHRAKKRDPRGHTTSTAAEAVKRALTYLKNRSKAGILTDSEEQTSFLMQAFMTTHGISDERALAERIRSFLQDPPRSTTITLSPPENPSTAIAHPLNESPSGVGVVINAETTLPVIPPQITLFVADHERPEEERKGTVFPVEKTHPDIRSRIHHIITHDILEKRRQVTVKGRGNKRKVLGPVPAAAKIYLEQYGGNIPHHLRGQVHTICSEIYQELTETGIAPEDS